MACSLATDPLQVPIDPNGNLTTKTEGTDNWTYSWNAEDQLTKVEKDAVEQARFSYDPKGRRVEKVAGGVTTTYTHDRMNVLREVRGLSTLKYIQGLGVDEPLAGDDGTGLSYFHADGLGSVVETTNSASAVTLARQYDAWGNLEAGGSIPGYAFTGREWDPETGLHYYRARYYDPSAGRFLSEDPLPDSGFSLYAYVHNDPVGRIDPSGEKEVCVHASSVYWAGYVDAAKHHVWPLRGGDPYGDAESYYNLIYFSGGCTFSMPRNAHLKNPPPNLPYTVYAETTGINTVVWKVSVKTSWIMRHGGKSGFQKMGQALELCYYCCNE